VVEHFWKESIFSDERWVQCSAHSMEFKESYIVGVGYSIAKNLSSYEIWLHKAKEIPIAIVVLR